MKVSYLPTNDFHNRGTITLIVSPATIGEGTMYRISAGQARRIEKHFCGVTDCPDCSHGAVQHLDAKGTECGIFTKWCRVLGEPKKRALTWSELTKRINESTSVSEINRLCKKRAIVEHEADKDAYQAENRRGETK